MKAYLAGTIFCPHGCGCILKAVNVTARDHAFNRPTVDLEEIPKQ
jgi:hypothetical protein